MPISLILIAIVTGVIIKVVYAPLQKYLDDKHADEFAKMMGWTKDKKSKDS